MHKNNDSGGMYSLGPNNSHNVMSPLGIYNCSDKQAIATVVFFTALFWYIVIPVGVIAGAVMLFNNWRDKQS